MSTNYLITKFKSRSTNLEYILNYANNYVNTTNTLIISKPLADFICNSNFSISGVKRLSDNRAFEDGDILVTSNGNTGKIVHITIDSGNVLIYLNTQTTPITLNDAQIYVEPVVEPTLNNEDKANFFLAIQNQIITANPRPIRLPGLLKNRKTQTLPDFLRTFFTDYNTNKDTIFVDNRDVQTAAGKRRSVGDIFMICRYYYSTCTLSQVYDILLNQLPISMPSGFRTSKCSTISKRVWYYDATKESAQKDLNSIDEYGNKISVLKTNLQ
jgi:hypothetical protein